ncbi:MAG TPA: ATP-binding protein [Caulobacteraceae bacterium]|nr:ATP-binding protein [Caulobacteraceae bacterium]
MTSPTGMFDLMREAAIVWDARGRILAWNTAATALYGHRADEALGATVEDLLGPLPFDSEKAPPPERQGAVVERRGRDGRALLIDATWTRRVGASGELEIVEVGRDIAGQRRMEAEFKRSELRYSSLFQAMAAAFWELDFAPVGDMLRDLRLAGVSDFPAYFADHPEFVREMMRRTRVVDVNDTTLAMFGIGKREGLADSVEPYWPEASSGVYAAAVAAAVGRKGYYKTETRLRRADGGEFDALFTAAFPHEGLAQGALLVGVIDISARVAAARELARSETRYRNLFHDMPIALWQIDARALTPVLSALRQQGVTDLAAYMDAHPAFLDEALQIVRVEGVNRRTVELFGGESEADFLGPVAKFRRARPDTFRRSLVARYEGALSHAEETRVFRLDGRAVDIHYTIAFPGPLSEIGVSIIGVLDIGDRLAAQADLRRVQDEFAHAARVSMLGELAASIAHEVNQPLAAISTNAAASLRWLSRPEPDVARATTLTTSIGADAQRAAEVIARVRGMAAKREPAHEFLSIHELVNETLVFLRHELQGREAQVEVQVEDLTVLGDRIQLQQVLVNLVMNAVQAAAPLRRPRVRIHGRPGVGGVEIAVADNGPGLHVDPESLFTSFYSTKPDGLGLGLPICRSIIEAHGGVISASNADPDGAVFLVRLPAEPVIPRCETDGRT